MRKIMITMAAVSAMAVMPVTARAKQPGDDLSIEVKRIAPSYGEHLNVIYSLRNAGELSYKLIDVECTGFDASGNPLEVQVGAVPHLQPRETVFGFSTTFESVKIASAVCRVSM